MEYVVKNAESKYWQVWNWKIEQLFSDNEKYSFFIIKISHNYIFPLKQ